jgi:hypothetical protein
MGQLRNSGQALIEYVILLGIVVSVYASMMKLLAKSNAMNNLRKPFVQDFAKTYQYGHPQARGQNDGGPKYIPQYTGADDFRIFINPPKNK